MINSTEIHEIEFLPDNRPPGIVYDMVMIVGHSLDIIQSNSFILFKFIKIIRIIEIIKIIKIK